MKYLLIAVALTAALVLGAETRQLYPSQADWRIDAEPDKDGIVRLVNRSPKDFPRMRLWMKLYKGQKLTFKVVLKGENIAAKTKPYQGVRFFLWGKVAGKSTEFGSNHDLKGSFNWVTLTNTVTVPENFDGWLTVGLREVTGTLLIKALTVEEKVETHVDTTKKSLVELRAEQIDLGFLCIAKRNPDSFEYNRMFTDWNKLRRGIKKAKEADALQEIDAFERFLLAFHQGFAGNSLSPNFYQWLRERRINYLRQEIKARITDWRNNAKALARFGLITSPELEIERMLSRESKYPGTKHVFSPEFDAAVGFFKEIAEERMRLGARLLALDDELPVLERIAALRNLSAAAKTWKTQWETLRTAWMNAFNQGDFLACAKLEKQAEVRREKLKKKLFADGQKTPVIRPGASLYATGVFGFLGTWHTLLCTNARYTT